MFIMLVLLVLVLLGMPLFAVIAASALFGFYSEEIDLAVVPIEFYRLASIPVLLAIPLFTFAGYLMGESGAATRLVRLTNAVLGWFPGGLAVVAIIACALFTAFTGASGVTIVALGALLYPALKQSGYPDSFSLGLVTTSGSLGILFAPSVPLILYAVVAQQMALDTPLSIEDLFLAGLLPGLLMLLVLAAWAMWVRRQSGVESASSTDAAFSMKEARAACREAIWEIPFPFLLLGAIYSGYLVVSEAAAITVVYVFIVEVLIYREIPIAELPRIVRESMTLVGGILVIIGVSLASTNYLIDTEVPTRLFEAIREVVDSKWTFLILLNVFLLIVGMMLDIFSALVVLVPLLLPVALSYGIHPAHLGIIFLANMQIGYFTPPVGLNLFIASYRFKQPILTLYRASLPFFFLLMATVLIITYVPELSLWAIDH
ncbi:MAG TPA: TRAP transporter large permease subunit [Chromatiaceae bacterium]|jgi:tripartite ATP-independent transporter DctM subunit|nr:TRAP transporter large permease subunit [Chromatiaceae bacterium]HIB83948.1 TRAP transporter large permease subunit [Chromatiaceae bacterium]HIN81643.1 TRAP transporter large permease subunit [Chromatiales bacterium]